MPHHKLLDVGFGSLRGGRYFIPYLDDAGYFGIDVSRENFDFCRSVVRMSPELEARHPTLICNGDFVLPDGVMFDFGIAQSVFTHLSRKSIRTCLESVSACLGLGGAFYATCFTTDSSDSLLVRKIKKWGRVTFRRAFHPMQFFVDEARRAGMTCEQEPSWCHPAQLRQNASKARKNEITPQANGFGYAMLLFERAVGQP